MRIAFYAPLKPPRHEIPSGDRLMARLLMRALATAGHEVEVASEFRSYDRTPDGTAQEDIRARAEVIADDLAATYQDAGPQVRPDAWFTYHVYYRAPDWLGPRISDRLGIPYLIAEPSFAPKRATGPWHLGHEAAGAAIATADTVFCLTRHDLACVQPLVTTPERLHFLPPFLDAEPFAAALRHRDPARRALAHELGLSPGHPWLLAVAMLRPGDKLASYRALAAALERLPDLEWQLVIVGEGEAREAVRAAFAALPAGRVHFAGARAAEALAQIYAACDLYVWPAVNEAYGMAFLEAQAAGLPVVACGVRGVPDVVRGGETGLLAPAGDAAAFAALIRRLLDAPAARQHMGESASRLVAGSRTLGDAARTLDRVLREVAGSTHRRAS